MKTIMIIDGANNCAYDCFLTDDILFEKIFPSPGQNIEFIEDMDESGRLEGLDQQFSEMWERPVKKVDIRGIDGILFYELAHKREYYPNKRDSDLDRVGRAWGHND